MIRSLLMVYFEPDDLAVASAASSVGSKGGWIKMNDAVESDIWCSSSSGALFVNLCILELLSGIENKDLLSSIRRRNNTA